MADAQPGMMRSQGDTGPLPTLKAAEQALIEQALARAGGNQGLAARMLGLTRRALNNRLQRTKKTG